MRQAWIYLSGVTLRVLNYWRLETVIGPKQDGGLIYVEFYWKRNGEQVVTSAWPEEMGPMRGLRWWLR